jgi:hypothetical protein
MFSWWAAITGRGAAAQAAAQHLIDAATRGDATLVRTLVEGGTRVNARGPGGKTALMAASSFGHFATVQVLLEKGADVDAKTIDCETAMLFASQNGHQEIVRALRNGGARFACNIEAACKDGDIAVNTRGISLSSISVKIDNLRDEPMVVRIPLGCSVNGSGKVQNMTVRKSSAAEIGPRGSKTIAVPAVCINARLRVPNREDRFSGFINSHSTSRHVERLLKYAHDRDPITVQLAVWIVTDNIKENDAQKLFGSNSVDLHVKFITAQSIASAVTGFSR